MKRIFAALFCLLALAKACLGDGVGSDIYTTPYIRTNLLRSADPAAARTALQLVTTNVSIGSTNAITTNSPSGMTNVVSSIATNAAQLAAPGLSNVFFNATEYLKNWRTSLAGASAGSGQAVLSLLTDSYGVNHPWCTNLFSTLRAVYGDAGVGFTFANTDLGFGGNWTYVTLTPVLAGGPWCQTNASLFWPLYPYSLATNAATLTWTNVTFATAMVYYVESPTKGGGSFQIQTNDALSGSYGTYATVSTTGAAERMKISRVVVPNGTYNLRINVTAALVGIIGCDFRKTNSGVILLNHGVSGTAASEWVAGAGVGDATALTNMLTTENPNLVVMDICRNDALRYKDISGLSANLNTLIANIKGAVTNADIALLGSGNYATTNAGEIDASLLEPIERSLAVSNNIGYIDVWHSVPSWTLGNSLGLFSDAYHMSDAGSKMLATIISRNLIGAPAIETAAALNNPPWTYLVNFRAHGIGGSLSVADSNAPQLARDVLHVAASSGAGGNLVVKIPAGMGFTKTRTRILFEGGTGATNLFLDARVAGEENAPSGYGLPTDIYTRVSGVTNGVYKSMEVTNTFTSDLGARDLFIQFVDTGHSTSPTSAVDVVSVLIQGVQ